MKIPSYIQFIMAKLAAHGYRSYIVGGAVRDKLLNLLPRDWDLVTDAPVNTLLEIFPRVVKTGLKHGTVTIVMETGTCEITTMTADIERELGRRDFTINAIAYLPAENVYIDPFGGRSDLLEHKLLRGVQNPAIRMQEDPIRLLRAVRFLAQFNLALDVDTKKAIEVNIQLLMGVAPERIRDELTGLLLANNVKRGLYYLRDSGLLAQVIPELAEGQAMQQSSYHFFDVLDHGIEACAAIEPILPLRLAALLHDVGKPPTRQVEGEKVRFDGHHIKGAERSRIILTRLRYPQAIIGYVVRLVYHHMFYYHREIDDAGVRRIISEVGLDLVRDLLKVRAADFYAVNPDRCSDYIARLTTHFNQVLAGQELYSVHDLAINGKVLMTQLRIPEGPEVGRILRKLLAKVQEKPELNTNNSLLTLASNMLTIAD